VGLEENPILFLLPFLPLNLRIQVIEPPLSTLFSHASWAGISDSRPLDIINPHQNNHSFHNLVLLFCPAPPLESGTQDFVPTMLTAHVRSACENEGGREGVGG